MTASAINKEAFVNYAAFMDPGSGKPRIGHLDTGTGEILPLSYKSGTPLTSLYEVIEIGEKNINTTSPIKSSSVKLLPPISGRDVLAVGKNYVEHAKEFNASGYDASDKQDQPTHPVIFTKRFTSIIASGEDIYPHPGFTESPDYEGEICVIIGKAGFRISESEAMDHVWGYTIINDVTARERQRDHKQFYIGKSPDTFCPMGPTAVPKEHLPKNLTVTTHVNGEQRQKASLEDLIFSIPILVKTLSEGQTLQPGDVLATGTPYGVGFGFRPMIFLKPGDEVKVSVTGIGELINRIASPESQNPAVQQIASQSVVPVANDDRTPGGYGLTQIGTKRLFYQALGKKSGSPVVFIHGLGGSHAYFGEVVASLTGSHSIHLSDLEGHGLSPTSASSELSITSFAKDIQDLCSQESVTGGATVVGHSMGCLIAMELALKNPQLVSKLVLMGPPPSPLPEAGSKATHARAALVRQKGMFGVAETVVTAGTSDHSKTSNPLAISAARVSLLGTNPEGYAKACTALANSASTTLEVSKIKSPTLILTGSEDKVSPPELCKKYVDQMGSASVEVLSNVGHWHLFEEPKATAKAVVDFIRQQ